MLGAIAHVTHLEGLPLLGVEREVAIKIGDSTLGSTLDEDRDADERFALLIAHDTGDVCPKEGREKDTY